MSQRNYDTHRVIDRNSGGMFWDVKDGDVEAAAYALASYLRRDAPERPISLYEEKVTHRVEWRELDLDASNEAET